MISEEQIKDFFESLKFTEKDHCYSVNDFKIKVSVSGIVENFYKPFDSDKISLAIAKGNELKQEKILKDWSDKKNKSINVGNNLHEFAENYHKDKSLSPKNIRQKSFVEFYNYIKDKVDFVGTEIKMYHKKYKFAGTMDALLYDKNKNQYIILDYKTNKNLFKNYKDEHLLTPFYFLKDMPINKYKIQLSLYQILIEQMGINISKRCILWLKSDGKYQIFWVKNYANILRKWLTRYES